MRLLLIESRVLSTTMVEGRWIMCFAALLLGRLFSQSASSQRFFSASVLLYCSAVPL
jgi:hypothetical protein